MASHLTFTSPTITDGLRWGTSSPEREEFECLANSLVQRLKDGSLPPNDAYWWTQVLCAEPFMREPLAELCSVA